MPSDSQSQARTARVALQVKRGKMSLAEVSPKGFRDAVKSMLSMSEKDLEDFTKVKEKAPERRNKRMKRRGGR